MDQIKLEKKQSKKLSTQTSLRAWEFQRRWRRCQGRTRSDCPWELWIIDNRQECGSCDSRPHILHRGRGRHGFVQGYPRRVRSHRFSQEVWRQRPDAHASSNNEANHRGFHWCLVAESWGAEPHLGRRQQFSFLFAWWTETRSLTELPWQDQWGVPRRDKLADLRQWSLPISGCG